MKRAGLALLLLAGCAPQPLRVGIHADTVTGRVSPSVATSTGGVTIAANGGGGAIGTTIGGIGLSAGF